MTDDIEIWKPVVGCETEYEVSNHGRVRSVERIIRRRYRDGFRFQPVKSAILRHCYSTRYLSVTLSRRKTRSVHQLVIEAFIGPRPTDKRYECLHGDGDRMNNNISNLRWGTSKENKKDAIKHGVWTHGEMVGCAKLNENKVMAIRSGDQTLKYFGQLFGVSIAAVSAARNYKTWKHLP